MSYFVNLFSEDFKGNWVLGDRNYSPVFPCPKNAGRGSEWVTAWQEEPYNLSGNDADTHATKNLTIWFSLSADNQFLNWNSLTIDITSQAASNSAVKTFEIAAALAANNTFSSYFKTNIVFWPDNVTQRLQIHQLPSASNTKMRFYIARGTADTVLQFNQRAGVSQLPTYFARHTVNNKGTNGLPAFNDGQNMLIQLNPGSSTVDNNIVTNAVDSKGNKLGLSATVLSDYQLLQGRSGIFLFQNNTVDGSGRITASIEFPAGAQVGDLAKKTTYSYTGTNTNPTLVASVPYTLTSGDLFSPP